MPPYLPTLVPFILYVLETLEPKEHGPFMREHSALLIDFAVDSFEQMSQRIRADEEYRKRFLGEKGFEKHMFLVPLLSLCLKYVSGELGASEKSSQLVNIVRSLLLPGNERHVRASGMRLLLSWLKVRQCPAVLFTLFGSAIDLKELGMVPAEQPSFPVHHGEKALFASAVGGSALDLLEDTLRLFTFDPEPDQHSVKVLFDALRTCYLDKLYHQQCSAPPHVQEVIIRFTTRWTLPVEFIPGKDAASTKGGRKDNTVSTLLIGELIEQEASAIHSLHKIVAAGLKLPYSHHASIKACLAVLRSWLFAPIERQPVFIQEASNEYAQRYVELLRSLFDRRQYIGFQREQVDTFQDAVYFIRALAMQAYFPMAQETWESVIRTALFIGHFLFSSSSADLIVTPALATELAHLYGETLWVTVLRSNTKKREIWESLADTMQQIQNTAVFQEWSKVTHSLTDLLVIAKTSPLVSKSPLSSPTASAMGGGGSFGSSWMDLASVQESLPFLWKNSLRAVGDLFTRSVDIREEIALTFARVTDKLLKAGKHEFELARLLLRVAYEAEGGAARKAALSVTCRLYCLSNIERRTSCELGMFFSVLRKALGESYADDELLSVLLENTSDLYSQEHLPQESLAVLVPLYLDAIERLLLSNNALLVSKLWDVCRLLGDIYLFPHTSGEYNHGERIMGMLQRLYAWSKQDVDLEGPVLCTVGNLAIQSKEGAFLGILLEAVVPRDGVVCYRAIEAMEAMSFMELSADTTRLICQRIVLAVRACLLPVPGGDNRKQDIVGARLLGTLRHYQLTNFMDLCDNVWLLLEECENGHVVPGVKETEMGRAAKYLRMQLLDNRRNHCTLPSDVLGAQFAIMQGNKVRSILSGTMGVVQSRNVSGLDEIRFHPGKPVIKKKREAIIIKSAQVLPEVDAFVGEDDFEDVLLQDLLEYNNHASCQFEVDTKLIEDVMGQVQKLYQAECEHAAHYRALIRQEYISPNHHHEDNSDAEPGQSSDLRQLLTNLELLGLQGFEYQLVRDVQKVEESDAIAPKEVIQVAAPQDKLVENDICLLKLSSTLSNEECGIGINIPGAAKINITVKKGSIQVHSPDNIIAAPIGFGCKLHSTGNIYPLLLPTLLQLNRHLSNNQEKLIHPYSRSLIILRYSGRQNELQKCVLLGKDASLGAFLGVSGGGEWTMKAAAIDGITATSPTQLQAPRYSTNSTSGEPTRVYSLNNAADEMQIY